MVALREPPLSQVVLTPEEQAAQMEADGMPAEAIEATLLMLASVTMRRQTEYDKKPPSVPFQKVPE